MDGEKMWDARKSYEKHRKCRRDPWKEESLGRPRRRWKILKILVCGCKVATSRLVQDLVAASCGQCTETYGSRGKLIEKLSCY